MLRFTGWDVIPPGLGIGGCKKKAGLGGDPFIMGGPEDRQDQI